MTKTRGQIAYEAAKAADPFTADMVPDWKDAGIGRQKMWEAGALAVHNAALKKAVALCETERDRDMSYEGSSDYVDGRRHVAQSLAWEIHELIIEE